MFLRQELHDFHNPHRVFLLQHALQFLLAEDALLDSGVLQGNVIRHKKSKCMDYFGVVDGSKWTNFKISFLRILFSPNLTLWHIMSVSQPRA